MNRLLFLLIAFAASVFGACPSGHVLVAGKCVSIVSRILIAPTVTLTAAQVNAMYTTPVLIIPAQGAGLTTVPISCIFNAVFGSAAFTGGGNIFLTYGATSQASPQASSAVSPILLTSFSANQMAAGTATHAATPSAITPPVQNSGLYLTNATAVFAVGTGSSLSVNCLYYPQSGIL